MFHRIALVVFIAAGLWGCASSRPAELTKPGATAENFNRDLLKCKAEKSDVVACMKGRGWSEAT